MSNLKVIEGSGSVNDTANELVGVLRDAVDEFAETRNLSSAVVLGALEYLKAEIIFETMFEGSE